MSKNDSKSLIIAATGIVAAVVMGIISWSILPDAVSMQFPGLTTGAPLWPKAIAVLFASGISIAFSLVSIKTDEARKYILIGYALHILYWIANV